MEYDINPYLWAIIGGLLGLAAGTMAAKSGGRIFLLENIAVGIFGAFIGGDFLPSMFGAEMSKGAGFSLGSLGFAVMGAVVLLLLLRMMHTAVGPMHITKSKVRRY